jgi:hypothetical protein
MIGRDRLAVLVGAGLGVSCFALYVCLAARDVMWGDGLELVASAITNGVAHPPGYPLWIVLGHLASLVPIGDAAFRVNVTAAFYHAATVGIVYASAYVLTRSIKASCFAALVLAVGSPLFVVWSLQAEVFSLNDLFAAAIVFLCLVWLDDPRRLRLVVPLGALFGFGLSNHQTLVLIAPLVLWTLWCARQTLSHNRRAAATFVLGAFSFIACFCIPYIHTLLVSQTLAETHFGMARTLPQLLDVIDRKAYGSFQLEANPEFQGGTFVDRLAVLIAAAGWPVVFIAAGIGTLAMQRRYRELGAATLLALFTLVAFCAVANSSVSGDYSSGVWARFGLLPLVALAPFSASAFAAFEVLIPGGPIRRAGTVIALCVLLIAGLRLTLGLSLANIGGPRTYSLDIFNALPKNAILLTGGDAADLAPAYFQTIEKWRPDIALVAYEFLGDPRVTRGLAGVITVPIGATRPLPPETRRDALIDANRSRPFFVTGPSALAVATTENAPYSLGLVAQMLSRTVRVDVRRQYDAQRAIMSAPGYGDVAADRWRSNGWGAMVREYYASGFLSAGINAERLRKIAEARHWYSAAKSYMPDTLVQNQWAARLKAQGISEFEAAP